MASVKKPEVTVPAEKPAEFVLVPFAYASAKDGEVVQLVKGGVVNTDRYRPESIEHLRSLGFIGPRN